MVSTPTLSTMLASLNHGCHAFVHHIDYVYATPTSMSEFGHGQIFIVAMPLFYKPQVSSSSAVQQNISVVQLIIVAILFSICHAPFSTCHAPFSTCHALLVRGFCSAHWSVVLHVSVTLCSYGCHAYAGHNPYLFLPHEKSLNIVTVIYISCRKI